MQSKTKKISLVLADDHPLALDGIRQALNNTTDLQIIGEAQNGIEAQQLVVELRPRVLLLDLKMPDTSPVEVEKWVRENYPETATLVLTGHDRDFYLAEMMDAGVVGYFSKNERLSNLISAIRRAAHGETLFTNEQIDRARCWRENAGRKWKSLTKRECVVLKLLVQGLDNAALAYSIDVTERTAIYHVTNILEKLKVTSRQEAVAWAVKHIPEMTEDL